MPKITRADRLPFIMNILFLCGPREECELPQHRGQNGMFCLEKSHTMDIKAGLLIFEKSAY